MNPQWYKCPKGHYVRVTGENIDPHNDIIIDLHCYQHKKWMQPVPKLTTSDVEKVEQRER